MVVTNKIAINRNVYTVNEHFEEEVIGDKKTIDELVKELVEEEIYRN